MVRVDPQRRVVERGGDCGKVNRGGGAECRTGTACSSSRHYAASAEMGASAPRGLLSPHEDCWSRRIRSFDHRRAILALINPENRALRKKDRSQCSQRHAGWAQGNGRVPRRAWAAAPTACIPAHTWDRATSRPAAASAPGRRLPGTHRPWPPRAAAATVSVGHRHLQVRPALAERAPRKMVPQQPRGLRQRRGGRLRSRRPWRRSELANVRISAMDVARITQQIRQEFLEQR